MKIPFRQGIVRAQTDLTGPSFLRISPTAPNAVDLVARNVNTTPVVLSFSHYDVNYLFEETNTVVGAWGTGGPNNGALNTNLAPKWLYWDISLDTAERTFGWTLESPVISPTPPPTPVNDLHWFDTSTNTMRVYKGIGLNPHWQDKIRLFAAVYQTNGSFDPPYTHPESVWVGGSQVAVTGNFEAGNILFGVGGRPLRQNVNGYVTFATTVSLLSVSFTGGQNIKFDASVMFAQAAESIPKFSAVTFIADRFMTLASSTDQNSFISGVVIDDLHENDVGQIVTSGVVRNEQWDWGPQEINKPLFCGANGEISLNRPMIGTSQQIGFVYDQDSVYIHLYPPIRLR